MKSSSKIALISAATSAVILSTWLLTGCENSDPTAPKDSTIDLVASPPNLNFQVGETTRHTTLTATVLNSDGNPVSDIGVHFSRSSGTLASGGDTIKTDHNGEAHDTLTLSVDDDDSEVKARAGGATTATITVAVNAPGENKTPVPKISPDPAAPLLNTPITFSGATSTDEDGTIVSYEWTFSDGVGDATSKTVPHTFTSTGPASVSLKVTDDGDGNCDGTPTGCTPTNVRNDTKTVNFTVAQSAPVAVISNGSTIQAHVNVQITLDGAPSHDSDGTIVTYAWTFGDGNPGVTNTTPSQTHSYATVGTFPVTLIVTDNGDGTACNATTHLCHGSLSSAPATASVVVTP